MKKIIVILFLIISGAQAEIFYSVSKEGEQHYLLGTMHSDDPQVLALIQDIKPYLIASDQLVLEVAFDMVSLITVGRSLLLPPEQRLDDLIGKELYQQVLELGQKKGLPEISLQHMKPWAVALTLGLPQDQSGILDKRIYTLALKNNKEIAPLETAAEQMALFDQLSLEQQKQLLQQTIEHFGDLDEQYQQMIAVYLQGDLDQLQQLSLAYESAGDAELQAWFQQKLIIERNQRMAQRLGLMLKQAPSFIAIGALHLPGETGLIAQLQNMGYIIKPLKEHRKMQPFSHHQQRTVIENREMQSF